MNTTERQALAKIVKSRFQILREQLAHRRGEIESMIRDRLLAETEEARTLAADQMKLVEEAWEALWKESKRIIEAARKKGVELGPRHYGNAVTGEVKGTFANDWQPIEAGTRVHREVQEMYREANVSKLALDSQEQQLLEAIYVEALESDEAKELLAQIPDVDSLLPLPEGTKKELSK